MVRALAFLVILLLAAPAAHAGEAKGTVAYKGSTLDFKYAYLVQANDVIRNVPMRRIILSTKDIGAKIASCAKMSCVDGDLGEGLELDFVGNDRLRYWLVMDGQKVQHSGTEPRTAFTATADDAKRVAGKVRFDNSSVGGAKVDVQFDAAFVKELK